MNTPNKLTLLRILLVPVFLLFSLIFLFFFGRGRRIVARLFGAPYLLALFNEVTLAALGALFARGDVPA